MNTDGKSEFTPDLIGTEFQFATAQEMFLSLVGMARERIVERCLEWGADYIMWADDDMILPNSALLSLYRNQKDICGALAFTSRDPIQPVIYKFKKIFDEQTQQDGTDISVIEDYERDALQKVDAIGSGVVLVKADAYRKMGKPWYSSYGMGEDIFRCHRAAQHGIEVWVDTRVKTHHKKAMPQWHNEDVYLATRPA
jgi:GT2 family glycosyltransferase